MQIAKQKAKYEGVANAATWARTRNYRAKKCCHTILSLFSFRFIHSLSYSINFLYTLLPDLC